VTNLKFSSDEGFADGRISPFSSDLIRNREDNTVTMLLSVTCLESLVTFIQSLGVMISVTGTVNKAAQQSHFRLIE